MEEHNNPEFKPADICKLLNRVITRLGDSLMLDVQAVSNKRVARIFCSKKLSASKLIRVLHTLRRIRYSYRGGRIKWVERMTYALFIEVYTRDCTDVILKDII